jgi:hypothetical protein
MVVELLCQPPVQGLHLFYGFKPAVINDSKHAFMAFFAAPSDGTVAKTLGRPPMMEIAKNDIGRHTTHCATNKDL